MNIESLKNGELIISGRQIMNEAGELGAVLASGEEIEIYEGTKRRKDIAASRDW